MFHFERDDRKRKKKLSNVVCVRVCVLWIFSRSNTQARHSLIQVLRRMQQQQNFRFLMREREKEREKKKREVI